MIRPRSAYAAGFDCVSRSLISTSRSLVPASRGIGPTSRGIVPTGRSLISTGRSFIPTGRSFIPASRSLISTSRSFVPTCRWLVLLGRCRRSGGRGGAVITIRIGAAGADNFIRVQIVSGLRCGFRSRLRCGQEVFGDPGAGRAGGFGLLGGLRRTEGHKARHHHGSRQEQGQNRQDIAPGLRPFPFFLSGHPNQTSLRTGG